MTSTARRSARIASTMTGRKRGDRGRYWTSDRIIEAARDWAARFGQHPTLDDWGGGRAKTFAEGNRVRMMRWVKSIELYETGDFPAAQTVREVFGSWNAAMTAAGFEERPALNPKVAKRLAPTYKGDLDMIALQSALGKVGAAKRDGDTKRLRTELQDLANCAWTWAGQL